MQRYIINGEVYNEDEVEYVYFYDQDREVVINRKLTDEELDILKEFDTKEDMIEYLEDEGLECGTCYNDQAAAECLDDVILNLDDFKMQTVEELDCCEAIIVDYDKISGHDPYLVYRLEYEDYDTYETEDLLASFTLCEDSYSNKEVAFLYNEKDNKLIGIYNYDNYSSDRVEAEIMDMDKIFKLLNEHLNIDEIAEICQVIIDEGLSEDLLPKSFKEVFEEVRAAEEEEDYER